MSNKKHIAHLEQVRRQDRAIRITAAVIAVLVVAIVLYGILASTVFLPYRAVASVNGSNINVGDFQKQVKMQRLQTISQFNQYYQFAQMFGATDPLNDPNFGSTLQQLYYELQDPNTIGQKVIDRMVEDELVRQEANRRGLSVSAEELDAAMQEGMGFYANGTPTPAPSATPFEMPTLSPEQIALVTLTPTPTLVIPTATATADPNATPTATLQPEPTATAGPSPTPLPSPTPYTLEGFQLAFDEQMTTITAETDMSEEDYRKFYNAYLLREKLQEDLTKDLTASEEQVWARHILVADEAAAQAVLTRLQAGEDFAALAAELSMDGSGAQGGDLGWFGKGAMVAPFEETAFALSLGEISAPVQSEFGWHIIQVLGHENRPLTEDAFAQYKYRILTDFLENLKEEANITINETLWQEVVPAEPALQ